MTQLFKVKRADWCHPVGAVYEAVEGKVYGTSMTLKAQDADGQWAHGLFYADEVEEIRAADLVGAWVSPVDDRWANWPVQAYEVIEVSEQGVKVRYNGRTGVFIYGMFKVVATPLKTERVVCTWKVDGSDLVVGQEYEVFGRRTDDRDDKYSTVQIDVNGDRCWIYSKFFAPASEEFNIAHATGGRKMKFRSGCEVAFIAYVPSAKPHCQLVLLNPSTGNVVTRYANGKSSTETVPEPGDIIWA